MKTKKLFSLLLVAAMLLSMLAACGGSDSAVESAAPASSETVEEAPASEESVPAEEEEVPVEESVTAEASVVEEPVEETVPDGPVAGDKDFDWSVFEPLTEEPTTLTMFYTQPPMLAALMDSPNDMSYLYQTFEEITNVSIEFQMVNMMDASTTFQLMIASGDYCDIINDALNYYDTKDQAYEDGIAVNFLDYTDSMPNFAALMEEYPQIESDLKTEAGYILNFPRIDLPLAEYADGGFLIRQDWLTELGMDVPKSYSAMEEVMAAFKSEYGVSDPYVMPYQVLSPWGLMASGYGIAATADSNNFYLDLETDTIAHGPSSDAYYDMLTMFRSWYEKGLISSDFTSYMENLPSQDLISNEQAGIWYSDVSYIKTYEDLLVSVNPNAEIALMSDPGIDDQKSGYMEAVRTVAGTGGFSVSEDCDDVELAIKWCDMWYDPALTQFINYGYEGETFEYDENGTPKLGGIIVNNDLGLPSLKMANGVYLCTSGGFIYDWHKYDDEYTELQLQAYDHWINKAEDPSTVTTSDIPGGATLDADEASVVSAVMSDINTYVAEMALKFVTGVEELNEDTYADYVANIEGMNLQDALDAQQDAYERYLER